MDLEVDRLLAAMLRQRAEEIAAGWRKRLLVQGNSYQRGLTPATELSQEMAGLLDGLAQALQAGDERFETEAAHPLASGLRSASQIRAARGFTPEESLLFVQACKAALLDALHGDASLQTTRLEATLRLERLMDRCVTVLVSALIDARETIIKRQSDSLREVSTPVISMWDSVLLMPLVGVVDSVRAQQISEGLLEAIGNSEAEVTLIDVTGVPVMDTSVARHILKTVAAAEMLGTRVILTGISPSAAQTMVKLGIDMSGVPTRGSLKAGMALALALTGRHITDIPKA
jgi:rsbT co-antagonist protein RsbR